MLHIFLQDVPLVKAANKPPDVIPGHAERSPTEETEFELVPREPPTKLSEDEVQQLDQDCMERFIKLKVKHITDGQVSLRHGYICPNKVYS